MIKDLYLGLYLGNIYLVNSEKHVPWIHLTDFITNPYKRTLVSGRNFALELIIVQYLFQICIWKQMLGPNPRPKARPVTKRLSILTSSWLQKSAIASIWQGTISESIYKLCQIFLKLQCEYEGSQRCIVIVISYHRWDRYCWNAHIRSPIEKACLQCRFLCEFYSHFNSCQQSAIADVNTDVIWFFPLSHWQKTAEYFFAWLFFIKELFCTKQAVNLPEASKPCCSNAKV